MMSTRPQAYPGPSRSLPPTKMTMVRGFTEKKSKIKWDADLERGSILQTFYAPYSIPCYRIEKSSSLFLRAFINVVWEGGWEMRQDFTNVTPFRSFFFPAISSGRRPCCRRATDQLREEALIAEMHGINLLLTKLAD